MENETFLIGERKFLSNGGINAKGDRNLWKLEGRAKQFYFQQFKSNLLSLTGL